jgi:hypothetical protein
VHPTDQIKAFQHDRFTFNLIQLSQSQYILQFELNFTVFNTMNTVKRLPITSHINTNKTEPNIPLHY